MAIDFSKFVNKGFKVLSEEEEKAAKKESGGKGPGFMGAGTHEGCKISAFELRDEMVGREGKIDNAGWFGSMTTYENKEGQTTRQYMSIPTISVKMKCKGEKGIEEKMYAYNQFLNFFRTVFNLKDLTSGSALLLGNAIVSGELDLVGSKLDVIMGFKNGHYHTVKAEDPNDPEKKVIKIGMKVWNRDTKKEEFQFLTGKGIGAGDRIFETFEQANAVLDTLPKSSKFPEVLRICNDKTQETPEDMLAAQEFGKTLESGAVAANKPQPIKEFEEPVQDEVEDDVPDIFG